MIYKCTDGLINTINNSDENYNIDTDGYFKEIYVKINSTNSCNVVFTCVKDNHKKVLYKD